MQSGTHFHLSLQTRRDAALWQNTACILPFTILCPGAAVDRIQQLSYEKDFRIRFLESRGDAFQHLFETVLSKRYPGDFMACRPWGRQGDRKNDGYLPSARTLFQVYAPNQISSAETVAKIEEDFAGAKPHWQEYFDRWVFVHNAHDQRLPPDVIKTLLDLRSANPQIAIEHWGYEELLIEFRGLKLVDLESWFGMAFSAQDKAQLGYAELQAVIEHIKLIPEPPDLAAIPHPRIGWTGSLHPQLDYGLIATLAQRRPDWAN